MNILSTWKFFFKRLHASEAEAEPLVPHWISRIVTLWLANTWR